MIFLTIRSSLSMKLAYQYRFEVFCGYGRDSLQPSGGEVLPYSLGGGVPLGSRKSYPLPN